MVVPKTEVIVSKEGGQLARYVFGPGEYVLGGASECEIVVDAEPVSRRHAKLTVNYNEWIIEDLGSSSGTFVNGKAVTEPVKVWPSQRIGIGSATVILRQFQEEDAGEHSLAPATAELRRILPPELLTPRKYEIGGVVAQGGMGAILNARDLATRRTVAMKVMLSDMSREDVLRFIEEAQVTAQLEHPNIVPIHDLSVDEQDHVFYTMKFVKGVTLKAVLQKISDGDADTIAKFPLRRLMQMMLRVCDAIAFANSKGVIHRDLKPENIMIGDFGEVLVMDWGLVKILGNKPESAGETRSVVISAKAEGGTEYTLAGSVVGTPHFMSPEQAMGDLWKVDARSDVYAIGAIIYQILTLHPPASGDSVEEVLDKVRHHKIATPTSFNSPPAKYLGGKIPLPHCPGRRIPGALSAIAMKAMSFEREDRYPNATELKADIDAWLGGFATRAEQAGVLVQVWLLIKRNKGVFGTAFAAWLLLMAVTAWFIGNLTAEIRRVVRAERRASLSAHEALDAQHAETEQLKEAARGDCQVAEEFVAQGRVRDALAHLARALVFDPTSSIPAEMAVYAEQSDQTSPALRVLQGHEGNVLTAQFSPDGSRIVTNSDDKTARVWDAATGSLLATLLHTERVQDVEFSPDGSRIVTACWDKTARIWDTATGRLLATLNGHDDNVQSARFSPDGSRVVTACWDKKARVWEAATGKLLLTLHGHDGRIWWAEFSPDGSRIVTASQDKTARVWDAATGNLLVTLQAHEASVGRAQFSPDGARIVTASDDKTARVWDAATGKLLETFRHEGYVWRAQYSPEGSRIVTTSSDKTARIWDAATGELLATLRHEDAIRDVEFSPDGTRIVTASWDKTARVWDAASGSLLATLEGHEDHVVDAQFSPDGSRIVTASADHTVRIWDATVGELMNTLRGHRDHVDKAYFSPDGSRIVTASDDKTARVWDPVTGKLLATLRGHQAGVWDAEFSKDGSRIVTTSDDKTARIWEASTGELVTTLLGHGNAVQGGEFSPDGSRVITSSLDGTARVWDAATGRELIALTFPRSHSGAPYYIARFSPDGSRIVTHCDDVRIWDATDGRLLLVYKVRGHAFFSADGSRILALDGGTGQIRDVVTGGVLATLRCDRNSLGAAAYSPDGSRILTYGQEKIARVWNSVSCRLLATLQGHESIVDDAEYSPDGSRIVTASEDKTARIWEAPVFEPPAPKWFGSFLRWLGGREFDSNGELAEVPVAERLRLKGELDQAVAADKTAYGRIAGWFLLPPDNRPIRPGSTLTQKQAADELITPDAGIYEIQRAYDFDPLHPLLQLALARFETSPQRAAFLREYSLKRLPETTEYLRRAAEFLAVENQSAPALDCVNRALRLSPDDRGSLDLRKRLSAPGP